MKSVVVALSSVALLAVAAPAFADQCAWTNALQANGAKALLQKGSRFATFCKPCGEKAAQGPFVVQSVTQRVPGRGYKETVLNGQGIDLAYVYVETRPGTFMNLAQRVNCPATGVPSSVQIKPAVQQQGQKH